MSENSLSYNDVTEQDADEIVKFLSANFSSREPLSKMLYMTSKDYEDILATPIRYWIQDGVSVLVRDGNSKKIVGCVMATVLSTENFYDDEFKAINIKVENLNKILEILKYSVNLFKKYDVKSILDITMVSVDHTYAGRGIGRRLVSECEKRGLERGCQMATAQATNISSQTLFGKVGYLTETEIDYHSMKKKDIKILDTNKSLGTDAAKVVARRLIKVK